jgi:hypothetical protein
VIEKRRHSRTDMAPEELRMHERQLRREGYARKRARELAARAPDPILAISDIDLSYIAGIVDGEGSVHCCFLGKDRRRTCHPIISVAMTDEGVIRWLGDVFAVCVSVTKRKENYRTQFTVRLSGKRAVLLANRLIPFLRVKAAQAVLMSSFPADGRIGPGNVIEGTALNEMRLRLYDQINSLNIQPRNAAYARGIRGAKALEARNV